MIKKQSYAAGKDLLEKKAFMYTVFKFYGSYLLPLALNVAQVVRLMLLSGLYALGNTWILAPGDRPLDVIKIQALWSLVNNPELATMELVSIVLYGDPRGHKDGQPRPISVASFYSDDNFVTNRDVVPLCSDEDPLDTIDWEDAHQQARSARCTTDELNLVAGHFFGENDTVPASAIATHICGNEVQDVWATHSIPIPRGTDTEDVTNMARPFSPTQQITESNRPGWTSDDDETPPSSDPLTLDDSDSDTGSPSPSPPPPRR